MSITLNYIGSKKSLLEKIDYVLNENINLKKSKKMVFGDLFSGTNVVSQYFFNKYKFKTISNDLEKYSYIIGNAYLKCGYTKRIQKFIHKLNELKGEEGLIYKNYSPEGKRMFWTKDNAKKIDAIRIQLNEWIKNKKIKEKEFNFLLATLIFAADKVANVASVYGAFLKKFKDSALKDLKLIPIHTNKIHLTHCKRNLILQQDINTIEEEMDIAYLDPPYNNRQYSANYFPLNYIVDYDENIKLRGKTGIIEGNNISKFCQKQSVLKTFMKLIQNLNSKHILLSYNNEGLLSHEDLKLILNGYGDVKLYKIPYKKFINSKKEDISDNEKKKIYEYLFYLKKNKYIYEEIDIE